MPQAFDGVLTHVFFFSFSSYYVFHVSMYATCLLAMTGGWNDWDAPTGVEVQVGWPGSWALDRCPLSCISAAFFSGIKSAML